REILSSRTVHLAAFRPYIVHSRLAHEVRSSTRNAAMLQDATPGSSRPPSSWNSAVRGAAWFVRVGMEERRTGRDPAGRNAVTKENGDEQTGGDHRAVEAGCGARPPAGPRHLRPLGVRGPGTRSRAVPSGLLPWFSVRHRLPPEA